MLRAELSTLEESLKGIFDDKELDFMAADLGTMNANAFINDMGKVLEDQRVDVEARAESVTGEGVRVTLQKVFGLRDMSADAQLAVARMMSKIEAHTGLKNDEAVAAFAEKIDDFMEAHKKAVIND